VLQGISSLAIDDLACQKSPEDLQDQIGIGVGLVGQDLLQVEKEFLSFYIIRIVRFI